MSRFSKNNFEYCASFNPMAKLNVVWDDAAYQQVMYLIKKAPGEISGFGKVVIQDDGTFKVVAVCLSDQKNTSSETELDAASIGKSRFEMRDVEGEFNFHWHSHVDFDVFWSGTDITMIREIGSGGWVLAMVLNKRAEYRAALYVKANPPLPELFIDEIPVTVERFLPTDLTSKLDAEYDKKCKPRWEPPTFDNNWGWSGDDYSGYDWRQQGTLYLQKETKKTEPTASCLEQIDSETIDMESEPDDMTARRMMNSIISKINRMNLTKKERRSMKAEIIQSYNVSRRYHQKQKGMEKHEPIVSA